MGSRVTHLPRTIIIVGAGFSGALVATNLLRLSYWRPLSVVLIDRAPRMARGAAYAERAHPYLLNVPAGRMSVNSHDPLDFLKFAQQRLRAATADDFLPRSLYGEYLEASLLEAELASPPHLRLSRLQATVSSIERSGGTSGASGTSAIGGASAFRVKLEDGRILSADDVVLALGNPPPGQLPATQTLLGSPRYVADPWSSAPEFPAGETVLIIGTGLTMADAVIAGAAASRDKVVFHAISRHGLVPPSQTAFRHAGCEGDSGALLRAASFSAKRLVRAVRELTEDVQLRGGDWREAVTCVRNLAPALWQRLPTRERKRFLRHVRPYWDIHRHRLPQQTLAQLEQLRREDNFHVHAGRILDFELVGDYIRVRWRPRGSDEVKTLLVNRVINCTGADYNPTRSRDPLVLSLLAQGLAAADGLGLGLRTGTHGALIDSRGRPASHLYYIGPMLRADHWECTAAQELRGHAERLAHHLATPVAKPMFALERA
ncbi:MAG: hypothetical protein JWN85_2581 [Gammaproteobacteria bacterium]|nr:hypothetical protein [Gammaproteobacteria bacterium]